MEKFLFFIIISVIVQFCKCQRGHGYPDIMYRRFPFSGRGFSFPNQVFSPRRRFLDRPIFGTGYGDYDEFDDFYEEISAIHLQNQLVLLSSNNNNNELDNHFINLAKSVGYVDIKKIFFGNKVEDTIIATQKYKNVINLQTSDFYNFNYKDIEEKGVYYAGNIDYKPVTSEVCVINTHNNTEDIITDCIIKYQVTPRVKLISKAITESDTLDDLVAKFPENKAIILICYDGDEIRSKLESYNRNNSQRFISLEYTTCNNEIEETNSNLLAVFTPKPLVNDLIRLSVPRYFYGNSILFKTHGDIYPNSMNVVPDWQPLPHAFLKFINTIKWIRIAVISDHAQSSQAFETNLIQLFDKHKIIYTVKHCMNKDCDFEKELTSLKEANARIIIVNIENQKYAENFLISAQKLEMAERSNIVWIIREWPFHNYNLPLTIAFTISLGVPVSNMYENDISKNYNVPELRSIFLYVEKIADEFRSSTSMYLDYITNRDKFYRKLAQNIQSKDSNASPFEAHVKKLKSGQLNNIFLMKVYRDGQVNILPSTKDPFPISVPGDSPKCALSKGRTNFYKPCNDNELVLIMIVFSALFLAVPLFIIISDIYIEYLKKGNVSRERLVTH